ncbi:class I SAM-dependent methyltransferase [Pseudomonas sp. NPDC090202]|uniref:class I SAM-dependent methyltransferase n=1 Tax=unclassified Pseudomonas TaxID=196821 RepID=UPI003812BD3D
MTDVRKHYQGNTSELDLLTRVEQLLAQYGSGPIGHDQLAGFDQFHSGGLKTTAEFIGMLDIRSGMQVLDAGSGLGGPSRYVAEQHDCHVTGVDLTESFVAVARLLAQRTGLDQRVDYQVGNLCALSLGAGQFDVAYTQHVVMNIADRETLYRQLHRVLKPGGQFGFFDVLAADGKPAALYPTPWAQRAEDSFLLDESETRAVLQQSGFSIQRWVDVTEPVIQWFLSVRLPSMQDGTAAQTPEPTLKLVMGNRFAEMAENFARNLREGKLRLVMAVCGRQA